MNTEQRLAELETENATLRSQLADYRAKEKTAKDAAEVKAAEDAKVHQLTGKGFTREQALEIIARKERFATEKQRATQRRK